MMKEKMMNLMEINEEKSIKNTKLYIRNLNINAESYESKILLEENVDNVLKFKIIYEGENTSLQYDVSNTLSLEEYLANKRLTKSDICYIMDSIDNVLSTIENYLLSENSVSLDTKLVRVKKKVNNKIALSFVLIPNFKSDFSYELSKFLIRILRYVDVNDKEALTLAYGLFVRSSKDNYTINDLMELVDAVRDNCSDIQKMEDIEALNAYDEEIAKEIDVDSIDAGDEIYEEDTNDTINSDDSIIIDNKTKELINDELFDNFDGKNEKKVIKFKKKLFNFKGNKSLNAGIRFSNLSLLIPPLVLILVPMGFSVIYGAEKLLKYIPIICIYECVIVLFFVILTIRKTRHS